MIMILMIIIHILLILLENIWILKLKKMYLEIDNTVKKNKCIKDNL